MLDWESERNTDKRETRKQDIVKYVIFSQLMSTKNFADNSTTALVILSRDVRTASSFWVT